MELEIAANVLPQKFPSAKTIFDLFFSIPFLSYPQRLTNLQAVSPASTPKIKSEVQLLEQNKITLHLQKYT